MSAGFRHHVTNLHSKTTRYKLRSHFSERTGTLPPAQVGFFHYLEKYYDYAVLLLQNAFAVLMDLFEIGT